MPALLMRTAKVSESGVCLVMELAWRLRGEAVHR